MRSAKTIPHHRVHAALAKSTAIVIFGLVMLGGKDSYLALGIALGFAGALTAFLYLDFGVVRSGYCASGETHGACAREWLGALSGWVGGAAAIATILVIYRQIAQARELRDEERQSRAAQIADAITVDLIETSARLRSSNYLDHLEPPLATTSRQLLSDSVLVTPVLMAALQMHCTEVGNFSSRLRAYDPHSIVTGPSVSRSEARDIAYRARILSLCFATASRQITRGARVAKPLVTQDQVRKMQEGFEVNNDANRYLSFVLDS